MFALAGPRIGKTRGWQSCSVHRTRGHFRPGEGGVISRKWAQVTELIVAVEILGNC